METGDEHYLIFRQTKYSVDGTTLAPMGGYLSPGEDPLEEARREVLEETGYISQDWIHLGIYRIDANRGMAFAHLFLARVARRVAEPQSDDLEDQQLMQLTRTELEAALKAGEFKILSWAMVVALALQHTNKP